MRGTIDDAALVERRNAGALSWRGPVSMLVARSAFAVGAQALVAGIFALRSSSTPWRDAEPWMPVYGTLIDVGCLALLWHWTRREGIRVRDLIRLDRPRLGRDLVLGLALIPIGLALIVGGVALTGWMVYGTPSAPYLFDRLPLPATLYGVFVFPVIWGLTEQMTYNGYLMPRVRVLCRSTGVAVALVSIAWSFQHAVMPLTFDAQFMTVRALSPLPFSIFQTLLYLRLRRLVPFVVAHALMDGASGFIGGLLPYLRG